MKELVGRNSDIVSTALRSANGTVLAEAGDHRRHWVKPSGDQSTLTHAQVPIFDGAVRWGTLEVSFAESPAWGLTRLRAHPLFRLLAFIGTAGFVIYLLFMRRTLRHLDLLEAPPRRTTVGDYVGLCLLIDFSDGSNTAMRIAVQLAAARDDAAKRLADAERRGGLEQAAMRLQRVRHAQQGQLQALVKVAARHGAQPAGAAPRRQPSSISRSDRTAVA